MLLLMKLQSPVLRKLVRKFLKKFFLLNLRMFKKFLIKSLHLQSTPSTPSVVEGLADIPISSNSESYEEKEPSSKIKLNHPSKVIVGNINELTLRKCTVDKCVSNFVSYSCYLT